MMMLGLLKHYKGRYYLKPDYKDLSKEEVCFYLEREWRYLPIPKNGEAMFLPENDSLVRETIVDILMDKYNISAEEAKSKFQNWPEG